MKAVVLVLNKIDLLEELLATLSQKGVRGGTIVDSTGMARALGDSEDFNILGSLRMFLDPLREESKTVFFIVKDEQVDLVRKTIDSVVGGLNNPDTGIVFGVNLDFLDGVSKI